MIGVKDHQQFRRTVLCILLALLIANSADVHDCNLPVLTAGSQDGFVGEGPLDLYDLIGMALEGMQLRSRVAEIPEGNSLRKDSGEDQSLKEEKEEEVEVVVDNEEVEDEEEE